MQNLKRIKLIEKIPALLFSVFSIIFSLSILKELYSMVETYFLIALGVFIVSFLIYNEIVKVRELRNLFSNKSYSKLLLSITLLISISLSSLGIYFWTNKTHVIENDVLINKSNELNSIEIQYNSIEYPLFETTQQYKDLQSNISYWQKKSAGSLKERTQIRNRINSYQNTLIKERSNYDDLIKSKKQIKLKEKQIAIAGIKNKYKAVTNNSDRNNNISLIFLVMILITEGLIVMLNKDLCAKQLKIDDFNKSDGIKKYFLFKSILSTIYLTKNKDKLINIREFMLSNLNVISKGQYRLDFDTMKLFYNGLHSSNVVNIVDSKEGTAKLLHNEKYALKKLDKYFKRVGEVNEIF